MNFISCRIWSVCMLHIVCKLYGLNSYFLFLVILTSSKPIYQRVLKSVFVSLANIERIFIGFLLLIMYLTSVVTPTLSVNPTWLISIQSSTQLVNFNINCITILFLGNTVFVTCIYKLLDPLFIFCFISTTVHLVFKINLSIFLFVMFLNFFIKNIF